MNESRERKVISCQKHICDLFMNSFQSKHAVYSSQSVEEKAIKKSLTWQANKNKLCQPTKQHISIWESKKQGHPNLCKINSGFSFPSNNSGNNLSTSCDINSSRCLYKPTSSLSSPSTFQLMLVEWIVLSVYPQLAIDVLQHQWCHSDILVENWNDHQWRVENQWNICKGHHIENKCKRQV